MEAAWLAVAGAEIASVAAAALHSVLSRAQQAAAQRTRVCAHDGG